MSSFNTNADSNGYESSVAHEGSHHRTLPSQLSKVPTMAEQFDGTWNENSKAYVAKEEFKVAWKIIRTILTGKTDSLKPNSGDSVRVSGHLFYVTFREETDYRSWTWDGYISIFDEKGGHWPEFVYGYYLEQLSNESPLYHDDRNEQQFDGTWNDYTKAYLAEQESKVAEEIISTILTGKTDSLKPNSGNYAHINGHHLCVAFREEMGCRAWMWAGFMSMDDGEGRYWPEPTCGNYLEKLTMKENENEGLGDLNDEDSLNFTICLNGDAE